MQFTWHHCGSQLSTLHWTEGKRDREREREKQRNRKRGREIERRSDREKSRGYAAKRAQKIISGMENKYKIFVIHNK